VPEWLSLDEAAKRLKVHPTTLREWADKGRIRAYRTPGGHRRFSEADVETYAASLQDEPEGARLISTGQAARLLGVSQPTLNRAVRRGRLRPTLTTPGGHRRFDSAELSAALYYEETP